jgi:cation transport ATPase
VSVPTAILASLNRAAAHGILIRSGRALEALAEVDVVVFDKTGTLTTGEPALLEIEVLDQRFDPDRLLQLAASAEQGLNHPIALAITAAAERRGLAPLPVEDWQCQIGRGVRARQAGRQVLVGNRRLLREEGLDPPPTSRDSQLRVATPILVAVDGRVVGILYVADRLRPDSAALLRKLRERGIDSHLLTGDVEAVALQVGRELGLPRSRIHAEALPDLKAEVVRRLKAEGKRVAFVGDGLNDSAALAYADVAVSFRHGSDLARETAEIVLCGERISQLLDAHALARFSFAVVRQNIAVVAVPNLTALVVGLLLPIPPLLAILINNGTCILAALNALRPLRHPFSEAIPGQEAELAKADQSGASAAPPPMASPGAKEAPPFASAVPMAAAPPSVPAATSSPLPAVAPPRIAAVLSSPPAMPLAPSQLARRLRVSTQRLVARRRRDDFHAWSAEQDPQRLSWRYDPSDQRFHPVAIAAFDHDAA